MFARINMMLGDVLTEDHIRQHGLMAAIEPCGRVVTEIIRPAIQSGDERALQETLSILSSIIGDNSSILQIALLGGLNADDIRMLVVANRRIGVDISGVLNATPPSHRATHEHSALSALMCRSVFVQNRDIPHIVYGDAFIHGQRDIILALSDLTSPEAILASALIIQEDNIRDPRSNDILAAISSVFALRPDLSMQWSTYCEGLVGHQPQPAVLLEEELAALTSFIGDEVAARVANQAGPASWQEALEETLAELATAMNHMGNPEGNAELVPPIGNQAGNVVNITFQFTVFPQRVPQPQEHPDERPLQDDPSAPTSRPDRTQP